MSSRKIVNIRLFIFQEDHSSIIIILLQTNSKKLLNMINFESFSHEEIPYGILQKFGLSQEMIDDLPGNVMHRFLNSRPTPVLPVITENAEGQKIKSFARISLIRLGDGTVDACFAPQWEDEDLSKFTPEQQEILKNGGVTTAMMPGKGRCFVQFDDAINQVMAVPVTILNQNVSVLTRSFELSDTDKETLEKGGVVQMIVNQQTVSAGIDLKEDSGIRIADGDIITWQEDAKADRLPRYNFGIFGCWLADDDNVLSYVTEDDYGPELLAEQKRAGVANAAQAQMKMS